MYDLDGLVLADIGIFGNLYSPRSLEPSTRLGVEQGTLHWVGEKETVRTGQPGLLTTTNGGDHEVVPPYIQSNTTVRLISDLSHLSHPLHLTHTSNQNPKIFHPHQHSDWKLPNRECINPLTPPNTLI